MSEPLPYYDYHPILTRNGTFNFIVGGRGLGKTYGAKLMAIKNFVKRGEEFIYLRRYHSELAGKNTFFADLVNDPFIQNCGFEFRVNNNNAEARPIGSKKNAPWTVCGYFAQLSNALTQKSIAYPKVTTIIYDEFIILKGVVRYLANEVQAFQEFYSTVDRWKDKTRVFFLANSISIMNPYFAEYEIEVNPDKEWITKKKGFIVAHFPDSEAFKSAVFTTKFGEFIKDTEYAAYSVGNQFADNHNMMVRTKPERAKYFMTLETDTGVCTIWLDYYDSEFNRPVFYVSEKRPISDEHIFTMLFNKMDNDKHFIVYGDPLLSTLRTAFNQGRVFFSNARVRNAFGGLYKR